MKTNVIAPSIAAALLSSLAVGATTTRSIVIEKDLPQSPETVWRALTQSPVIKQWLMDNDFEPVVGHKFTFHAPPRPYWNGVVKAEVMVVEPNQKLSYSWNASAEEAVKGQGNIVEWTLVSTEAGTHVRVELSGLATDHEPNYQGAKYTWLGFVAGLERVVAEMK